MPSAAFGRAVARLRQKRGLSQEALALKCGINRTYMTRLEQGKSSPTLTLMLRVCDGLGISFAKLAGVVEEELKAGRKNAG